MTDFRQRFFIENSPVRGDVVQISHALTTILAQRPYPKVIALLLGEMLAAACLLASTLKFKGRLSIQLQGQGALKWATAECSDMGHIRALAQWDEQHQFSPLATPSDLISAQDGVLFINIEPEHGTRYQGIIALDAPTLAGCLEQYYHLSAQTPTQICLASSEHAASGLLLQLLPRSNETEQDHVDTDLWPRMRMLTQTLSSAELLNLEANDVLHRLYHEENVMLAQKDELTFCCTCSKEKCALGLAQTGQTAVEEMLSADGHITMDCQFCNTSYSFSASEALAVFGKYLN